MASFELFGLGHSAFVIPCILRVVGEINLPPDSLELTAAGGDVIESDKSFEHLANVIQQDVKQSLEETHTNEVNLAKARWVQMMNRRLENVPEHRRAIVEERLNKLISRSYQEGEKEERFTVLVSLVLDALELDEYWTVCREIQEAEKADVCHFADALGKSGLFFLLCPGRSELASLAQRTPSLCFAAPNDRTLNSCHPHHPHTRPPLGTRLPHLTPSGPNEAFAAARCDLCADDLDLLPRLVLQVPEELEDFTPG